MDNNLAVQNSILVVEDQTDLREILVEQLEALGPLTIDQASNGQEALEMVAKKNYAAILLDIGLPQMSGLEFLKIARQRSILTPAVFLSGRVEKHDMMEAIPLGAIQFLEKPCQAKELIQAMKKALDFGSRLNHLVQYSESQAQSPSPAFEANAANVDFLIRTVLLLLKERDLLLNRLGARNKPER